MIRRKQWWEKKWGKDKLCGITHTRLRPGKNKHGLPYIVTLKCKHSFYSNALIEWCKYCANDEPTCPCCRTVFNALDIIIK
jgi:hypothetical protein